MEYHRNIVPITSAIWIMLIHTFIWYAYVVLFGSCWSIHSYDMHTYVPGKILYVLTCPTKNEFWFTLLFILVKVKWICYSSLSINPNSICLDWPTHLYRVRIRLFQQLYVKYRWYIWSACIFHSFFLIYDVITMYEYTE